MKLIKKQKLKRLLFSLFAGTVALILAACGRDPIAEIEKELKAETNPDRRELLAEYAQIFRQERAKQPFDATRGLAISVVFDCPENVEYFIERGGNVNAECINDFLMLECAAYMHFFDIVKILVENGADVNATSRDGKTPLMVAIKNTDYDKTSSIRRLRGENEGWSTEKLKSMREKTIHYLFEKGANLNLQDKHGNTAAVFAVEEGDAETLRWLIAKGADFRKGGFVEDGVTRNPLTLAAMKLSAECLDVLIAAGANLNENVKYSPLFFVLAHTNDVNEKSEEEHLREKLALAQKLVNAGAKADFSEHLVYFVEQDRDPAVVKFLLQNKANPNVIISWNEGKKTRYRLSGLHYGIFKEDSEMTKVFLDAGADPNVAGTLEHKGETYKFYPLHTAVEHGDTELVKSLIALKADLNAKNQTADTGAQGGVPVISTFDPVMLKILLDAGANPNEAVKYVDRNGTTVVPLLFLAVREGDVECVKMLLAAGADVNAKLQAEGDGRGIVSGSAIFPASVSHTGDATKLKLLLDAGANPNEVGKDGQAKEGEAEDIRPLYIATRAGNVACVNLLIAAGADVNAKNSLGETALFVAVRENQTELVKILLGAKADVNAKNSRGRDVLGEAVLKNNVEMVKLLLTAGAKPVEMIAMVEIPGKGFSIGKYEVTQAEYESVMGENPSRFKGSNRPVERVSWNDAMVFCKKLTERERTLGCLPAGYEYTLPTSEQWEYACRAGTTTRFYTGNTGQDLDRAGWYEKNSGDQTHPVGEKEPNAFGLYDMHGNVWEWCLDGVGSFRLNRGGSYYYSAGYCESSRVGGDDPGDRDFDLGFRVALVPVVQ